MAPRPIPPPSVFISYSHADQKWLTRLKVHLRPLEFDGKIEVWEDTRLRSGDKWLVEINKALARARVTILIISADFLASDFIRKNELPPLLNAAQKKGVTIIPVIASKCAFTSSVLGQIQAINGPDKPLNLLTKGQQEEVLHDVFQRVQSLFNPSKEMQDRKPASLAPVKATKTSTHSSSDQKPKSVPPTPTRTKKEPATIKLVRATGRRQESALLVTQSSDWKRIPVTHSEISDQIGLTLLPASAHDRAFLTNLKQNPALNGFVFRSQTYPCKLETLFSRTEGTIETWHLKATPRPITKRSEITYDGVSPDMQAQEWAALILLNARASPTTGRSWGFFNSSPVDVSGSPFPALYQSLKTDPMKFKKVLPLVATWYLQLSNTVDHILQLDFSLKGTELRVDFEGQRDSLYQDPPRILKIKGTCDMSVSTEKQLKLNYNRSLY